MGHQPDMVDAQSAIASENLVSLEGLACLILPFHAESSIINLVLTHGLLPCPLSATVSIKTVNRHMPSPRVYQVMHLRRDDVPRQESAGTGLVVLKVARVTGATL